MFHGAGYCFSAFFTGCMYIWGLYQLASNNLLIWLIEGVSFLAFAVVWYPLVALTANYTCGFHMNPDAWFWTRSVRSFAFFVALCLYLVCISILGFVYCHFYNCEQDVNRPQDGLMGFLVVCYGEQLFWMHHFLGHFKSIVIRLPIDTIHLRSLEEAIPLTSTDLIRLVGHLSMEEEYRDFYTFTSTPAALDED